MPNVDMNEIMNKTPVRFEGWVATATRPELEELLSQLYKSFLKVSEE